MAQVWRLPRRGSILIVEDSIDVCGGMLQLLELAGFSVVSAANGDQGLARLSASPDRFALLLLDLALPGPMSGYDLRARQLLDPAMSAVPTVVVTACEPGLAEREALHCDDWLDKPFRGAVLLDLVRRFVIPKESEAA